MAAVPLVSSSGFGILFTSIGIGDVGRSRSATAAVGATAAAAEVVMVAVMVVWW